ncbi:hypothetical protein FRB90_011236 [Tulasnella sp. 427]|nr:hypothetical protein FRB90_011236 [Tulasnella sp. 427]
MSISYRLHASCPLYYVFGPFTQAFAHSFCGITFPSHNKLWAVDVSHPPRQPARPDESGPVLGQTAHAIHEFLPRALVAKIFIADWEDLSTLAYFGRVGLPHIGESVFRHRGERGTYQVDYVHIGLLLGHLTDLLTQRILQLEQITMEEKIKAVSALTKTINPPPPVPPARGTAVDIKAEAERCPFGGSINSPGYNPRYAEEEHVEEPWPDESDSDEDDGPNPWANDDGEVGSTSEGSEDDYGEQMVVRRGRGGGERDRCGVPVGICG